MTTAKNKLQENISEVITALNTLKEDDALPKNVRAKIEEITNTLNADNDLSTKVGKARHVLDEISEDLNLQPFIRSQIWEIVAKVENLDQ